jgi:uncharacterized protein (DUF342 family)
MTTSDIVKDKDVDIAGYTLDIEISSNYYSAFLDMEIFDENCKITAKDIEVFLEEKNVVHGIDYVMIESIVNKKENGHFLIATGKEHVNGENAVIEYKFNTDENLHPEENKDGSVDYKEMHLLKKIKKNGILAIKIAPTNGENGVTITGKDIYAKNGKDINFKIGKGIIISEDGLSLYAEYDGAINFENGKVSVEEILELIEGVGINTGNIEFNGKVVVKGIVETGFSIKTPNDIIIDGIVEGATLISGGNIEISKGIQGNDNAVIECKKNFKANFVNSSDLIVNGDIDLDIIMHSQVKCNGKLTANGKKGVIVGGDYSVKKGIIAKVIGSEIGTLTNLKIGIDNELLNNYKIANENSKVLGNEFRELVKDEKIIKKKIDSGNRNQLILVQYKKVLERMKEIKPIIDQANIDVKEIRKSFAELKGTSVTANVIYPGTKLNITNTFYNIKDKLERVQIIKQGGEIKVIGS